MRPHQARPASDVWCQSVCSRILRGYMIQREERVGLGLASTSRNSTRWHKASAPTAAMRSSINCSRLNPASSPAMASSRTTCAVDGLRILPPLAGQHVSGGAGRILFTFERFFWCKDSRFPSAGRRLRKQIESDVILSETTCNTSNGKGCVVPKKGAQFYPFYAITTDTQSCTLMFGNFRGSEINNFGGDKQYGTPNNTWFFANSSGGVQPTPVSPPRIREAVHKW